MGQRIYDWLRAHRALLLAIVVALSGGGTIALVVDTDGDGPAPARTITLTVNTVPAAGEAPERTLEVPAPAVQAVARSEVGEHDGARDETPAGVPEAEFGESAEAQALRRERVPALPTAGASAGFAGCKTQFISSYSSRNGVRPTVQVVHYTVSPNRPGWSDVDAITAYFARSSTQASSNFVIDREGNCAYIVPIEWKAWTQGGGNPWAISYEIINTGSEHPFMESAGYAKLRSVMRQVANRTGIPLRRGAVSGCTPTRSGIVHHWDGGSCWGGHHDITPFSIDQIVSLVSAPDKPASPLTKVERRIVRGAARPAASGHSRRYWCDRDARQRATIRRLARTTRVRWGRDRGDRYQLLARPFAEHCR